MSNSQLSERAVRVIQCLGIQRLIDDHEWKDRMREGIFAAYRRDPSAETFVGNDSELLETAMSLVRIGASSAVFEKAVRELAEQECRGYTDHARRIILLSVALYVLDASITECTNDTGDWIAMREAAAAALDGLISHAD